MPYFKDRGPQLIRLSQPQSGFSVVEVLLAVGVFAIMFPAILQSVTLAGGLNNRAEDLVHANIVVENKYETLRSQGYNTIPLGTTDFSSELSDTIGQPRSASYTVSSPTNGVKQIQLTISYTDRGKTTTTNYATIITELGVAQ